MSRYYPVIHPDGNANADIMNVKNIRIEDFDYPLPDQRIALHPLADRENCRLLVADRDGNADHRRFADLVDLLPADSLLVCNDTRVINARIEMHKPSGSRIEIFLLEPVAPADYVLMFQADGHCVWNCLVGNKKRWKQGSLSKILHIDGKDMELSARIVGEGKGNSFDVAFCWNDASVNWATVVEAAGRIPIPPYLNRESEDCDNTDYQTVYARMSGSVAAPTAGLHFTPGLMQRLSDRGVQVRPVTLHVGAGTFQPVKSETIGDHPMHTETFSVDPDTVRALIDFHCSGRQITAVGTTSVRTLESLPLIGKHLLDQGAGRPTAGNPLYVGQWEAYESADFDTAAALRALADHMSARNLPSVTAATSIMIAPGFRWRLVDAMVTNFHQPQSTLLLLVSSFLGNDTQDLPLWRRYYDMALRSDYRFLSYGDACLFLKSIR